MRAARASDASDIPFQISQRADFFEEEVGLETTLKRPIVNTRDEPHCDPQKYRRLHVIVGDANMSEVATYLKLGTTAIVLAMIEDDVTRRRHGSWLNPVPAIRQVSHDPSLQRAILLRDRRAGRRRWRSSGAARAGSASTSGRTVSRAVGDEVGADVLARWESCSPGSNATPTAWPTSSTGWPSERLVDGYAARHGLAPGLAKLKALDLQYHDMRAERCLAKRVGLRTIVDRCRRGPTARSPSRPPPPGPTSAAGACRSGPTDIVAANWDSLVFDVGRDPLRRVPMMEPLRGTAGTCR